MAIKLSKEQVLKRLSVNTGDFDCTTQNHFIAQVPSRMVFNGIFNEVKMHFKTLYHDEVLGGFYSNGVGYAGFIIETKKPVRYLTLKNFLQGYLKSTLSLSRVPFVVVKRNPRAGVVSSSTPWNPNSLYQEEEGEDEIVCLTDDTTTTEMDEEEVDDPFVGSYFDISNEAQPM